MHTLLTAYYKLNENLVKRGILEDLPAPLLEYKLTYDTDEGTDTWRLHIHAGEMTLVCNLDEKGVVDAYLPFKQMGILSYLSGSTEEYKLSLGEYCDRIHPTVETILERGETPW